MNLYIKIGSITNAQRAQRILKSFGYNASIKRDDDPKKRAGCGYEVCVKSSDDTPVSILASNGIKIKGISQHDLS